MALASFKFFDPKSNPYGGSAAFAPGAPKLNYATDSSAGFQQPATPGKFSFDEALAYAIMQNVDPKARAEARKEELADTLAFQREQMKEALPYKLMFDLPGQLYQSFALPGQIRLAGAQAANALVGEGLRAAAAVQMPLAGYQRPNIQYF